MNATMRRYGPLALAICAGLYLAVMEYTGALPERRNLIKVTTEGVMQQDPAEVTRVTIRSTEGSGSFERKGDGWVQQTGGGALDENRRKALELAVKFMHTATPVQRFKYEDIPHTGMSQFGLDPPSLTVKLENADGEVLTANFGNMDNDKTLRYMRLKRSTDIYLMSGFVGKQWDMVAASIRK